MPEYVARLGAPDGTILERSYTSESEKTLRSELAGQYLVLGVRKKQTVASLVPGLGGRRGIKMKEFLLFNQELASLLKAGLPIVASLDILTERRKNPVFKQALLEVRDQVRGGSSLSEAFSSQGDLFPRIYCSTLASGERSGEIASVLLRYIGYQKTVMSTKRKVMGAMIYPAFLFLVSIGVIGILVTFVVPKFADFYKDMGAELPLITRVLLGLSSVMTTYFPVVAAVIIGSLLAWRAWSRTESGRYSIDKMKMRIPVLGGLLQGFAASRFVRTLGTLVAGGIPVVTALGIGARAVGNLVFERALLDVERKVREGGGLWQGLEDTHLFSDIAVEMTKVGESTGALAEMLVNVSDFYDEEIDNKLATLMALMEPVMLIGMGIVVAMMLLAMYLPLLRSYSLTGG
ncbi:MAG TPA: type II secretion system F family protein [Verrucomicrobiae bacterium]|nr:type II secretion system F family protein [Verrucomicrobiae bacterium]